MGGWADGRMGGWAEARETIRREKIEKVAEQQKAL